MTREEQRDMACTNWICSQENGTVIMARNVWKAAVEWADQHPHWIPVEEELPKAHFVDTSSKWVLVSIKGSVFIDSYNHKHKEWVNNGKCVDHWMPIVPPRKED